MKFGQIIKYSVKNIFLQNSCWKLGRLVLDHILFFKKALYKVTASGQHLSFGFGRPRLGHTIKTKNWD